MLAGRSAAASDALLGRGPHVAVSLDASREHLRMGHTQALLSVTEPAVGELLHPRVDKLFAWQHCRSGFQHANHLFVPGYPCLRRVGLTRNMLHLPREELRGLGPRTQELADDPDHPIR